jgi:hypothetical protein
MLDATERKTLAWSAFIAGVLCLIPGEVPKGPRPLDYLLQVLGRMLDHRATQGAWALCALFVAYHLWKTRKEALPGETSEAPRAHSGA